MFNLFDINGGGTIDADELDAALKAVEIHLTHQEIQDVLQVIDEDGAFFTVYLLHLFENLLNFCTPIVRFLQR